jgi:hypothetical protein
MAHAITHYDFKRVAQKLASAGFKEEQSEAIVEAAAEVAASNLNEIATKQDIVLLENKLVLLENKIEMVKSELKSDLIKWMVGLLFAQTTIMVSIMAIIKFVH